MTSSFNENHQYYTDYADNNDYSDHSYHPETGYAPDSNPANGITQNSNLYEQQTQGYVEYQECYYNPEEGHSNQHDYNDKQDHVECDIFGVPLEYSNPPPVVHKYGTQNDDQRVSSPTIGIKRKNDTDSKHDNKIVRHPESAIATKDLSLRMVSCGIQGIRKWSRYKSEIPMLFEVIGKSSSPLMVGKFDYEKKFLLKDNTGSINCVYYEVDRSLDRMIMGRAYRCVGNLKSPNFHCVSIRLADEIEIRLFASKVHTSQQLLKPHTSTMKEV